MVELNYEDVNIDDLCFSGCLIFGLNLDFSIMNLCNCSMDIVLCGNNWCGGYCLDYNGNICIFWMFDLVICEIIYWQCGISVDLEWQEFNWVDVEDQEIQFLIFVFDL